jgi:hypothetical protein
VVTRPEKPKKGQTLHVNIKSRDHVTTCVTTFARIIFRGEHSGQGSVTLSPPVWPGLIVKWVLDLENLPISNFKTSYKDFWSIYKRCSVLI